jgi:Lipid A core - O-antigen ligase and related enzymes
MRRKTHKPRHHPTAGPATPEPPFVDRLLWWIIVAGVVVIPCFVSPTGQESFRFPKLLLFRAEGIILLTIVAIAAIWGKFDFRRYSLRDPAVWLPLAIVGWTAITTITSHKPLISVYSLLTVVTGMTIFLLTYVLGRNKSIHVAAIVLIPALVNALVYWLQRAKLWNPLVPDRWTLMASNAPEIQRLSDIALQGNRNDVGTFLLIPSLLAIVLATTFKGRLRVIYGTAAVLLISALVLSRTLTAMIALVVGIAALGTMRSWRAAIGTATVAILLAVLALQFYPPVHNRLELLRKYASQKKYNQIFSGRLGAYMAAAEMAIDHPIVGVGPGVFGREFLPYKINVDSRYGSQGLNTSGVNFGEAHNDHLQVADETGVLGYVGLASVLVLVGALSFRRRNFESSDPRRLYAVSAAFPAALSFAVLALAQFPLQLASTLVTYAFAIGLMEGWSEDR